MPSAERASKRKRQPESDESDADAFSEVPADSSDDEVDISSALTGKKPKRAVREDVSEVEEDDGDEDLQDIIQESISRRNVRSGTELLKKTKGKKIVKGEVGGGSFQSMGACCSCHAVARTLITMNL